MSTSTKIAFERFWSPREEVINLADAGFLADPTEPFGSVFNPHLVRTADLWQAACVILLGDPGMGKSTALNSERAALETSITSSGELCHWVNAAAHGSEDRILKAIFESPKVVGWRSDKTILHLFVDGLDECQVRVPYLGAAIAGALAEMRDAVPRLRLRVACRTAEWPQTLEQTLGQLWEAGLRVFELAPLRRRDIRDAANAESLDSSEFIRSIDQHQVQALAMKPLTLGLLLQLAKAGALPESSMEVYRRGLLLLAEESNPGKKAAKEIGRLSPVQRLAVAARLAYFTVFSARSRVALVEGTAETAATDIAITEVAGGSERVQGAEFAVGMEAVRETLETGLFTGSGPGHVTWFHPSFADFLAANYLTSRLALAQQAALLLDPVDGGLPPQLAGVAAWAASQSGDLSAILAKADVRAFLRGDLSAASDAFRKQLVALLLEAVLQNKISVRWEERRNFRKLSHPDLLGQLTPFLEDKTFPEEVRILAVEIAGYSQSTAALAKLAALALADGESLGIRERAASAVARAPDLPTRRLLRPLIAGVAGDTDDELKGIALRALFPDDVDAKELVGLLVEPKKSNLFGAYSGFISGDLPKRIPKADIPAALNWELLRKSGRGRSFLARLRDSILLRALEHFGDGEIRRALAVRIVAICEKRLDLFEDGDSASKWREYFRAVEPRRILVEELIDAGFDPIRLIISRVAFLTPTDRAWITAHASGDKNRTAWLRLVVRFVNFDDPADVSATRAMVASDGQALKEFDFLALGHQQAKEAESVREAEEKPENGIDPTPIVLEQLGRWENGKQEGFWIMLRYLGLENGARHFRGDLEGDITALAGWKNADADLRARIFRAAERYLHERVPDPSQWMLQEIPGHFPDLAGYKAVALVCTLEGPDRIASEDWAKWAPMVVAFFPENGRNEAQQRLIREAHKRAPHEVLATLAIRLEQVRESGSDPGGLLWLFEEARDEELGKRLLEIVQQRPDRTTWESVLRFLLRGGDPRARQYLRETFIADGVAPCAYTGAAARLLFTTLTDADWKLLYAKMKVDPDWARMMVLDVAETGGFAPHLNPANLADLYIWLSRAFPHSEDPDHGEGVHDVTGRDEIVRMRRRVQDALAAVGTQEAYRELERAVRELPEIPWLTRVLIEARETVRRRSWAPASIGDLRHLAARGENRLVRSAVELLLAVVESLERFDEELHSENPIVMNLWDGPGPTYRPKDENHLSDNLKRHLHRDLKQRGILSLREVEVSRRRAGGAPGQRTDIHVVGVADVDGHLDRMTVIVEVKGCWHAEVETAMATQLRDRYLAESGTQHGVYAVGWFVCPQWETKHRKATPKLNLEEAREQFAAQARSLSDSSRMLRAVVLDTALR